MLFEHEKLIRKAMKLVPNLKPDDWDEQAKGKWPPKIPDEVIGLIEIGRAHV